MNESEKEAGMPPSDGVPVRPLAEEMGDAIDRIKYRFRHAGEGLASASLLSAVILYLTQLKS